MPEAAVEIVTARRLAPGATLVKLDSDIARPSAKDICVCKMVAVHRDLLVSNVHTFSCNMNH